MIGAAKTGPGKREMIMSSTEAVARAIDIPEAHGALVGASDPVIAQNLKREIGRYGRRAPLTYASSFAHLRQSFVREAPRALLVDDALLRGAPLAESLRQFESVAPVILLAPLSRQAEAAQLVAAGAIEFVARDGDYLPLAAGLIERRLRGGHSSPRLSAAPFGGWPEDIGEIFRHEINNPLTGILGNSELLLAHRDHLTAADTQRLQTVVDLAVRLRETIRRLSATLESQEHSLKSV
jgi:signal transduction histidine kinase